MFESLTKRQLTTSLVLNNRAQCNAVYLNDKETPFQTFPHSLYTWVLKCLQRRLRRISNFVSISRRTPFRSANPPCVMHIRQGDIITIIATLIGNRLETDYSNPNRQSFETLNFECAITAAIVHMYMCFIGEDLDPKTHAEAPPPPLLFITDPVKVVLQLWFLKITSFISVCTWSPIIWSTE